MAEDSWLRMSRLVRTLRVATALLVPLTIFVTATENVAPSSAGYLAVKE